MNGSEIELTEVDGVWVASDEAEQRRRRRDWAHEILWWFLTFLAGLTMFIYDVATGRLPNPLTLFGVQ
jgi:hypothetical protein